MQFVRCDACGAKALFAASRCPKCSHAFFLRNYRGQMVPLGHCRTCDTYYPRSAGGCKWCGTVEPEGPSKRTIALVGLAAAAAGMLLWFQGLGRSGDDATLIADSAAPASETLLAIAEPRVPVTASEGQAVVSRDSAVSADSLLSPPAAASAQVPVTTVPAAPTPVVPTLRELPGGTRWTRATAITYINVRSGADRKAPVKGVITPNMQVELGGKLYGWRQVRAPGLSGWADPRNFLADSGGPLR